VDLTD
jgi:hypothetical protein